MLLESIIAIALITVLMVALTALFISAMQSTAHQRATQGAVRIATDEIDQARGLGATGALSGRDQSSVQRQFAAAPAAMKDWLSTAAVQAFSATATSDAGLTQCAEGVTSDACAALPTTPVVRTVNNTDYAVNYYEQWCHLDASDDPAGDGGGDPAADPAGDPVTDGTPNCGDGDVATNEALREYLRVVVALTWTDSSCPTGGCSYVTSVMLSVDADPMFYFRTPPPPAPKVTGCTGQSGNVGDTVDLKIAGTDGFCSLSGGVPPITWGATGLPDGLAVIAAGRITGTIAGPPHSGNAFTVTLVATDAFLRTSSVTFDWTVTYPPLVAHSPGGQVSTAGAPLAQPLTLTVSGGSGSFAYTASNLPSGLTLQNNTIGGTPTEAGTFAVTLTATDATAAMTDTASFTWTVNPPVSVNPPPSTTVGFGGTLTGRAVASDGTPPYTYSLQNAPDWMHIDPVTGKLSGTAGTEIADYPGIVVQAKDSVGATATSEFSVGVYDIPTMVPPGDQTSELGAAVSLPLQTTCPAGDCTFTVGNLPGWLQFSTATGEFTGIAPESQVFVPDITVTITDADGNSASSQFNWVVGPQQTITSPGDQVWTAGVALDSDSSVGLQITADCTPAGPCLFSLVDPADHPLPPGLSMDSSGLITGTPSTPGTWSGIVVRVTDRSSEQTEAEPFSWTVQEPPTLEAPGNQRSVLGDPVSTTLTYDCGSQPCEFTATGLPPGLTLDDSGTISGTTTAGGKSIVTVNVTDKTGAVASRTFTWYVLAIDVPDQTIGKSGGNCKNDSKLTLSLATFVTGYSDAANLTFAVSSDLDTVAVSGSQLTITAPCSTGSHASSVTVTDSGGGATAATATATFTIKVS